MVAEDSDGRITDVTTVDAAGRHVAGELSADGSRWHSTSPLAADTNYTVRVSTEDEDGAPGRKVLTFNTGKPTAPRRSAPRASASSSAQGKGAYGVGQPLTAELSQPVQDPAQRAIVERALKVPSTPAVQSAPGTGWTTRNCTSVPQEYWPEHATIKVRSTLDGIKIGDRMCRRQGQTPEDHHRATSVIAVTDVAAHTPHGLQGAERRSGRSPSPPASPVSRPATALQARPRQGMPSYVCSAPP
ncbi:Ig-like domain-containing protein [Streptomyces hirsutus]